MSRFIKSYSIIPKDLFRINNGRVVRLRAYPGPRRPPGLFDLLTHNGMVQPKALNPATYQPPNGASMRPNTLKMQQNAASLRGSSACIYKLDAGIRIPDDLILVHEFKDHYSLQARNIMTVEDLNAKITRFLEGSGRCLSKDEWLREYPEATETE
ncbi:hypothetical protein H113_06073 [Trichophyton rubrum MR1459]|uniref:Tse2 ADP-ribosyltransferase toxin domain-containing protein n=1 Tax=Trichophyton rubrum (strain ATCC MYA-4607 / CBS 118892) TaxID=559305 RepID=F2SLP9_TRIRC|nr:uncharacterized protein TERG_03727 [Trichophyton rubrum CBS 118892]EGD87476.1 hypothetical protein TERG_03727 [Trichophyton rubrum CBS 118892]EZF93052.1 hypothetical protein H113_06073 [Trichophyton rubrum MR1459]EZG04194.1 hypothetical protein H106_05866 [Trichophyton rubrum CBS 735.88]KMQ46874.1 hypothetical protein HL42_2434 [Trichophyton rubrum]